MFPHQYFPRRVASTVQAATGRRSHHHGRRGEGPPGHGIASASVGVGEQVVNVQHDTGSVASFGSETSTNVGKSKRREKVSVGQKLGRGDF